MTSVVSCQACESYEPDHVRAAVDACFADLGGLDTFVKPGDRVFLKPNLLMPAKPEQAITTHPAVLEAVILAVKAAGGEPIMGDSPAATSLKVTARRAGLLAVAEQQGVPLADMNTSVMIRSERAAGKRSFEVAKAVLDADVVINLPKLKTHALTYITIAQKNLFGLVPGLQKGRWHMTAQAPDHFAGLLVDLYASIIDHPDGPRHFLHLVDGVMALEGNGPGTGGSPIAMGTMLASTDAVAVDRVACEIAGLDAGLAPVLRISNERGLGQGTLEAIELKGASLAELKGRAMQPPEGRSSSPGMQAILWSSARLRNLALDRPLVHREPCVSCGHCARICPAEAIRMDEQRGAARVDYTRCIRCYCCAEICPHAAIDKSAVPPVGRLLAGDGLRRLGMLALVGIPLIVALVLGGIMALDQPSVPGQGQPAAQVHGQPQGPQPGQDKAQRPPPDGGPTAEGSPPSTGPKPANIQPGGRGRDAHALPLTRTEAQLLLYAANGDAQALDRAAASARRLVREGEQHDYPRFLMALIHQLRDRPAEAQAMLDQTTPQRRHFWARFFAAGLEPAVPYLAANLQQACEDTPQALGEICRDRPIAEPPADYQAFRQASWIHHSRNRLTTWGQATTDMTAAQFFETLGILPGMDVVDIGAGDGGFAVPLAQHIGSGTLWATEIDPGLVDYLAFAAQHHDLSNLQAVAGHPSELGLEADAVDAAFACDVFAAIYASPQAAQDSQLPAAFMVSVARSLRPGGTLVVIDRVESPKQPEGLQASRLIEDLQTAGLTSIDSPIVLGAGMQLLRFEKPDDPN